MFSADPEVHPQNEDYWGHVNPIGPRACYDEGKRVAETMCYAYMKQVPLSMLWVFLSTFFSNTLENVFIEFFKGSSDPSRLLCISGRI